MRKVTVELTPNAGTWDAEVFDKIESLEILQMMKVDFDRGLKIAIGLLTLKEGFSLEEINPHDGFEVLNVIKARGSKYTCLLKIRTPEKLNIILKNMAMYQIWMDLIWDIPFMATENKFVLSAIGDKEGLKMFLEIVKMFGKVESIRFQTPVYQGYNILSCLTDRQKEVILEAKRNGYYEYPRRINGDQLAQKMGISKAATVEHLRKAEARIISSILGGY
jgi:hypothetical protein